MHGCLDRAAAADHRYPTTDFGWPVVPDGLHELLTALHQRYPEHPPFVVTENGGSYNTAPGEGGANRIADVDLHLRQAERTVADGIDVSGYYCWSLMDRATSKIRQQLDPTQ